MASISSKQDRLPGQFAENAPIGPASQRDESGNRESTITRSRSRQIRLTILIHADAFRLDPIGYTQAIFWRARGLRLRSRNRFAALAGRSPHAYELWISREEPNVRSLHARQGASAGATILPVIDCRRGDSGLEETLASLANAGGELDPVLIGGATRPGTIRVDHPQELEPFIRDERTWLCPSSPGDRFAPGAIRNYATAASQAGGTRIIYADDDLMRPDGTRCAPHFKPSWNPDLFENHDFVTGAAIVRASSDGLMKLPDADWAAALVDHGIKAGDPPKHVSLVLHHRCNRPAPRVPAKPQMVLPDRPPSVTTIIPTRNEVGLLRNCLAGLTRTAYPRVDCIVIDNDSDDPEALAYLEKLESAGILVMRLPGPFNFSALNNAAVGHARGEYLCFLNNDVEMLDADWLSLLVRQAVRMDVGAVGARLLYPDGSIQHAGVVTGIGGGAGHAHRLQREDDEGYFHRARLPQQVSAVTAACLVVAKEKFLAVEGFDEEKFTVAFNDVDLCLKLNAKGWQSFYEPRATLIHHESKSRGHDRQGAKLVRFAGELAALKRKWRTDQERDPFHHLHLSPFCEQFLIAV